MRAYIFPTDTAWARYLIDLQQRDPTQTEANFWLPSPVGFKALSPGDRFLFRHKKGAGGQIFGGALYADYLRLRVSEAWRLYGEFNGAESFEALHTSIEGYRKKNGSTFDPDPQIGCILLTDVSFTPSGGELPVPPGFPMSSPRGRGYGPEHSEWSVVEQTFADVLWRAGVAALRPDSDAAAYLPGATRERVDGAHWVRRGQRWFASKVLTAYERRCAITGSHIAPTLQAAHIRPIAKDGRHSADNGLLLRSDVHTLFDDGYLGLDEKHRLHVSRRLRADFGNGMEFYAKLGESISVPARRDERPSVEAVTWHMDEVFLR
ncbi:HNH endonuclease [Serinicoccus profundi]|uniref:HNH endonuclease n=1 Tax=Serinicoccus profundi TaxID=1078471 RepID=UPI000255E2C2|nr:HNH endonuclease [Serinicoccus profundi]